MITLIVPGLALPLKLSSREDAAKFDPLKERVLGSSIDLTDGIADPHTSDHYALQWGTKIGFQDFARNNSDAMAFTPGRQMGWPDLFDRIRARAGTLPTRVYDAACGFGGVL